MEQYIKKSALVAEIERRMKNLTHEMSKFYYASNYNEWKFAVNEYKSLISLINALEVKEDNLLTEKKTEKELAETYLRIFDKKFSDKLPKLKGKQLADFKNFINTCEQMFSMKYFGIHSTQGVLFEKMALLWAVWGQEHLINETN